MRLQAINAGERLEKGNLLHCQCEPYPGNSPVKWTVSKCLQKHHEGQSLGPRIPTPGPGSPEIHHVNTSTRTAAAFTEAEREKQHNPHRHIKKFNLRHVLHTQDGPLLSHRKPLLKDTTPPGGHRGGMEDRALKGLGQTAETTGPHDVPSGQKKNQKHRIGFTQRETLKF